MTRKSRASAPILCLLMLVAGCHSASAPLATSIAPDEGMWLPDAPPTQRLATQYGFKPSAKWLENLRLSSVRIGASGAFVSPDGLVLTNHHVAVSGLQSISRADKDYVADGFLAKSRADEIQLPGMELSVLVSTQDVTNRIDRSVKRGMTPEESVKARNAAIAEIERTSQQRTGLQGSVVRLYGGAVYQLYQYKRYSDVRLVFAPEVAIAFFGGDPDNFEYPRYDLDVAILRAYEDGKPARTPHYLKLSPAGVAEGGLVIVSGHPGSTDRLLPVAILKGMRDETLPLRIESLHRQEQTLLEYSNRGEEARRQAHEEIFSIQNSIKALTPRMSALKQTDLIDRKQHEEDLFRSHLRERPDLRHFDAAFRAIEEAETRRSAIYLEEVMLENGRAFNSSLFWYARQLVRLAAEDEKPDSQRLPGYTQARRKSLEHDLFADQPVYPELEIATLASSLQFFQESLGADRPIVRHVIQGSSPADRAGELVKGSKLASPDERRRIRAGGSAMIAASTDPMIILARSIDAQSRKVHIEYEAAVQEPQTQALTEINRARFALFGRDAYPDATGTLRFSFGTVKGYEQDGSQISPWTTMGGAFEHETKHSEAWPFKLPASWIQSKSQLDLQTPFNFVSTADITGGNSGSPVVNRTGELVGVIFDSNRQGVANNFAYTDVQARAVSVDSRAILETLRRIYHADVLLNELLHVKTN